MKVARIVLLCAATLVLTSMTAYAANPIYLICDIDDAAGPNEYTLTLPPAWGGGNLTLPLDSGHFAIQVDTAAGTAALVQWDQWVGAITIGGHSTGPIHVTLDHGVPSDGFWYGPDSLVVHSRFIFEFDDSDVRQFGLYSPWRWWWWDRWPGPWPGPWPPPGPIPIANFLYSEGTADIGGETMEFTCATSVTLEVSDVIPTFTEWGFIIFGLLLLSSVVYYVYRRRRTISVST